MLIMEKILILERLKEAREKAGYSSAAKAADAMGISQSTYRAHENGQNNLKFDDAERYAKFFKVTSLWLLKGEEAKVSDYPHIPLEEYVKWKLVPEYDVSVSAGGGALVGEENIKSQWPFDPQYINGELRIRSDNIALVEVQGDSMEPTLSTGDRVMVNMSDVNVSQPGIFVLHDGDGTVIKRLERVYDKEEPTIALISDNERHRRYEVPADRITVAGRVVWAAKRL